MVFSLVYSYRRKTKALCVCWGGQSDVQRGANVANARDTARARHVADTYVRVCVHMCGGCPSHGMSSHLLVVGALTSVSFIQSLKNSVELGRVIDMRMCAHTHTEGKLTLGFLCSAKASRPSSICTPL